MLEFKLFSFIFIVSNVLLTITKCQDASEPNRIYDKILSSVNGASNSIKQKFDDSIKKAEETAGKLQNEMLEIVQRVIDELKEPIRNFENEMDKLKELHKNNDTQECEALADTHRNQLISIIKNSSLCATDLMDEVGGSTDSLYMTSEKVQNDLNDIKTQSKQCLENVDGIVSGSKSLVCLTKLTAKSAKFIAEDVAGAITNMGEISTEIGQSAAKISTCYVNELILSAPQNVLSAIEDVNQCMQKITTS